MYIKKSTAILILSLLLLAPAATANAAGFMQEFARLALGLLDNEKGVREKLDGYILAHKEEFADGVGNHPEVLPGIYGLVGLSKVQCVRGKHFDLLQTRLTNRERMAFNRVSQRLDWWVLQLAVEEADRLKIYKPSPPLTFRRPEDMPDNIALEVRYEIEPFLADTGGGDFTFSGLECE